MRTRKGSIAAEDVTCAHAIMGGLLHLVSHLVSRRVGLTAACLEGCVVDEHVNAPILVHRPLHHLQAHLLIVQVAADEDALAALRLDDLLRVLRSVWCEVC